MVDHSVSVVCYTYKRPQNLPDQLRAIRSQTIDVDEMLLVHTENNGVDKDDFAPFNNDKYGLDIEYCHQDPGLKTKFSSALNCQSDFVLVLDDDVIPGEGFVENCLDSFAKKEGLYGGLGFKIDEDSYRHYGGREPSTGQNEDILEVDHVGQCWFAPYEYFGLYFEQQPPFPVFSGGDDIWFSYVLAQHGIKSYVPPHPHGSKKWWASSEHRASADVAICQREGHKEDRWKLIEWCRENGWDV